ncbi:hypothetical protein L202_06742 [Cryptococcus amylolentus CBS 6039]|uniref:Uncharacterized protein n=1 Tax=Cryptococcus amylolentus CBS 6039 TaxID=1295533 RepID=A0A1E3HDV8_9TREE|nr:hypothetical protein L202_06742 [Cryptococcus amylolentus CBS 6039]ODN74325.1 hypothetical protein L202_06742 [Cryptococcus amylolentus CBS 6039]
MRIPYSPLRNAPFRAASVPRMTRRAISNTFPTPASEPTSIPLDKAARAIPSFSSTLTFTAQPKPIRHTTSDDEKASLSKLLALCSSKEASEGSFKKADEAWVLYNELSIVYRRSLPIEQLHRIARHVLPRESAIKVFAKAPDTREGGALRKYRRRMEKAAISLEQRVRVLASDILIRRQSPDAAPDPRLYKFLTYNLSKLAFVGEKSGCRAILQEVKLRASSPSPLPPKYWNMAYNLSLQSINKWLAIHRYRLSAQGEIQEAIGNLKTLIEEMKERGVESDEATGLILLNSARYIVEARKDETIVDGFETLSALILESGFGIRKSPLGWVGLRQNLPVQVKLAIIEHVGRSGEIWDLVGVYEALYPSREREVVRKAEEARVLVDVEEEEEVPTLSQMVAKEKEERSHRDWLGRPLDEPSPSPSSSPSSSHIPISRPFDAYLPPIPTPSSIVPSTTNLSISSLSPIAQPIQSDIPYSYIFKTMLHYPWVHREAPGARDVALLMLRVALREAHVQQALWLSSLSKSNSDTPSSSSFLAPPALRVDFRWFQAAWKVGRDTVDGKNDRIGFWRALNGMIDEAESRLKEELEIMRTVVERAAEKENRSESEGERESTLASAETTAYLGEIDQTLQELTAVRGEILHHTGVVVQKRYRAHSARRERTKTLEEQRIAEEARWPLEGGQQEDSGRISKVIFSAESGGGVAGFA